MARMATRDGQPLLSDRARFELLQYVERATRRRCDIGRNAEDGGSYGASALTRTVDIFIARLSPEG